MPISAAALDLENRSTGPNGKPMLAATDQLLRDQWRSGERDCEFGLHLIWFGTY
jgi:hypothetical protein